MQLVGGGRRFVSYGRSKVFNPKRQTTKAGRLGLKPVEPVMLENSSSATTTTKPYSSTTASIVVAGVTVVHAYLAWTYHDDIKEYLFGIKKQ